MFFVGPWCGEKKKKGVGNGTGLAQYPQGDLAGKLLRSSISFKCSSFRADGIRPGCWPSALGDMIPRYSAKRVQQGSCV